MTTSEIALVAGMALVTFAIRYPLLAVVSRVTLPPYLIRSLQYVPPSVLAAIIVPSLLAPYDNQINISWTNDYLVAGIITTLVAWRTKNLLLTLGAGMVTLWAWRFLLTMMN